ncbi:hypothetical protein FS749_011656 [Ceratobasidium sp. UAMH 11750]|nr:hypothetical protein FS749_011656 [Ceratobasidium sp. UAMH 11750]
MLRPPIICSAYRLRLVRPSFALARSNLYLVRQDPPGVFLRSHARGSASNTHPNPAEEQEKQRDVQSQHENGDWVLSHPVYSEQDLGSIKAFHSPPKSAGNRIALRLVQLCRWGFDFFSGYGYKPLPANTTMSLDELRQRGYAMTERKWLMRIIFLESIAGVPGMVAGMLRHMRSLRLMKHDQGWIHTLLEDAENERMHLMTFMSLKKSSRLFRAWILGAQGVFYNAFFLGYLISPKTAHRFVGYLEEAVFTYTQCIVDIEAGRFPEWREKPAPAIALEYWRLPQGATMLDVVKAVRADEATHRFINHSLANLERIDDMNPFAIREPPMELKGSTAGFTPKESEIFATESRRRRREEKQG